MPCQIALLIIVRQPNVTFPHNPKISYIVFFMLIIDHWDVYNDIWGGVDVLPLSTFEYSRGRPRWLSSSLIFENVHYFFKLFRHGISGTLFPVPYGIILLMQEKNHGYGYKNWYISVTNKARHKICTSLDL